VPFRNPMFDVQDVFRFYRCPITDVHIGRSLHVNGMYRISVFRI